MERKEGQKGYEQKGSLRAMNWNQAYGLWIGNKPTSYDFENEPMG